MAKKLYDLTVKTGEYTSNGETKGKYQNVGSMMEGADGKPFLVMSRWFNLAGVPTKEGSDTVIVACFEPREKDGKKGKKAQEESEDTPF